MPRWVLSNINYIKIQIDGFSDASQSAYRCCLYILPFYSNHVLCNLIAVKLHIAPIKSIVTIPKLHRTCAMPLLVN